MAMDYSSYSDADLQLAYAGLSSSTSMKNSPNGPNANDIGKLNAIAQEINKRSGVGVAGVKGYLDSGGGYAKGGVVAAQSGVDAILGGRTPIMNQVGNINGQADALNGTADQLKGAANDLRPYADRLGGMGDTLFDQGTAIMDQAKDIFGQGGALVNMDPSKGGLSAEYIKYWNSLSPDRYVSQAASDTQNSFQNAQGQADRNMARRGVSAGSGASAVLQKQYAQTLATALAAAKTKARQVGLDQQAAQLDKMVGAANTLYNMGKDTMQAGLSSQNAGVDATGKAANVVVNIGDLLGKAGNLQNEAGQLYGTAGNLYNNYLGQVNSAYSGLVNANAHAASYYGSAAGTMAGLARGGGGGGGSSGSVYEDIDGNRIYTDRNGKPYIVNNNDAIGNGYSYGSV